MVTFSLAAITIASTLRIFAFFIKTYHRSKNLHKFTFVYNQFIRTKNNQTFVWTITIKSDLFLSGSFHPTFPMLSPTFYHCWERVTMSGSPRREVSCMYTNKVITIFLLIAAGCIIRHASDRGRSALAIASFWLWLSWYRIYKSGCEMSPSCVSSVAESLFAILSRIVVAMVGFMRIC